MRDRTDSPRGKALVKRAALLALLALLSCGTAAPVPGGPSAVAQIPAAPAVPPAVEPAEGIVLRGSDPRMLSFRTFLARSGMAASFGVDAAGLYVLAVARDESGRQLTVPYLWEHGDHASRDLSGLEDVVFVRQMRGVPAQLELRIPGWKRAPVPVVTAIAPRILFRSSTLNLPFDEETLLAFFHGLRDSVRHPGSLSAIYNPLFSGTPFSVRVHLFSAEIRFDGPVSLSPEEFFLWFYTLGQGSETCDDSFYAALLSLKVAKRLYTGVPSFLGGPALLTRSAEIPFGEVRKHLFAPGVPEFSGVGMSYFYAWRGPLAEETTLLVPPGQSVPVKAFFAAPEGAVRSIVSLVVRSVDALEKRQRIVDVLEAHGFSHFGEMYEQVGAQDAWAAVSGSVDPSREKEVISCYEKVLAVMDKTLSMGVYRVGTQER